MVHEFIRGWASFVVNQRLFVIVSTIFLFGVCAFPIYKTIEYGKLKEEAQADRESGGIEEDLEESEQELIGTAEEEFEGRWLYFDNSNEMWFLPDDPALLEYDRLKDLFGDSEYMLIGIQARPGEDSVFHLDTLKMIHKITDFLENHDVVTKVSSLSKYQYMISEEDSLTIKDLIEDIDTLDGSPESMRELRRIMEKEEMVHDFLISPDMKHTLISTRTIYIKNSAEHMVRITRDLEDFIAKEKFAEQGFKLHISGNPVIAESFQSSSQSDTSTIFPLMFLLILIFLVFSFRSPAGVFMPLVVIIGSVLSVIAALGYFEFAFNILNVTVPTLLIAVGVGDSVHILTDFYQFKNRGMPAKEAAQAAVETLWIPCFYTSITTAIGFLAISISDLMPVREYGYVAAIGVFVAFILSVTTLPTLLTFVTGAAKTSKRVAEEGFVAKTTARIVPFSFQYSKPICLIGLAILILAVMFAFKLRVDANWVNYFKKDTDIRKAFEYFDDIYRGGVNLEFIIDSGRQDGVKSPGFLNEVLRFQEYLESLEYAGKANSFLNYVREMNQTMHQDDPNYYRIPPTSDHVAQLLLLYENSGPEEDLSDLKTNDHRYMRLSIRIRNMSTGETKKKLDDILKRAAENHPKIPISATGNLVLFTNMDTYIQEGLVKSFSLAILLIVVCFFVLFRSLKYGFLSLIPSLFPIVMVGGLMQMLGNTLDFASLIVAAVTFGIAVDDTIHVMTRYIRARKEGETRKESMHLAVIEAGRALVFTSLILYFGFSILCLSSFTPNISLGFYGGVILLTALVSVLLLLPAVVFLTGDKGKGVKT